jgi:hypothetical protein
MRMEEVLFPSLYFYSPFVLGSSAARGSTIDIHAGHARATNITPLEAP